MPKDGQYYANEAAVELYVLGLVRSHNNIAVPFVVFGNDKLIDAKTEAIAKLMRNGHITSESDRQGTSHLKITVAGRAVFQSQNLKRGNRRAANRIRALDVDFALVQENSSLVTRFERALGPALRYRSWPAVQAVVWTASIAAHSPVSFGFAGLVSAGLATNVGVGVRQRFKEQRRIHTVLSAVGEPARQQPKLAPAKSIERGVEQDSPAAELSFKDQVRERVTARIAMVKGPLTPELFLSAVTDAVTRDVKGTTAKQLAAFDVAIRDTARFLRQSLGDDSTLSLIREVEALSVPYREQIETGGLTFDS